MTQNEINKIKARIIANTRTRVRNDNLYDIAILISRLQKHFGNLTNVSKEVTDISPNMLSRFLSILKIDKRIIPSIQNRQIDNINSIYYLQTLPKQEQVYLAKLLVENKINSADIRTLRPMKNKFPQKSIEEIISDILKSKNTKRYLIKFNVNNKDISIIESKLQRILPKSEFYIEINGSSATIYLSKNGYGLVKKFALNKKQSYTKIIKNIINN